MLRKAAKEKLAGRTERKRLAEAKRLKMKDSCEKARKAAEEAAKIEEERKRQAELKRQRMSVSEKAAEAKRPRRSCPKKENGNSKRKKKKR